MDTILGLGSVFCGCQANVFLLELITLMSPNTYYFLTFAQYVAVAVLALPLLLRLAQPEEEAGAVSMWPFRWRQQRLPLKSKAILAVLSWGMSVGNNMTFGFHISVPLHATFRSTSLMLNMLAGYLFLGKTFTPAQVMCAAVICGGLVALAVEKTRKQNQGDVSGSMSSFTGLTPQEYVEWMCGICILVCTTACSTAIGIFQERMYAQAAEEERWQFHRRQQRYLVTNPTSPRHEVAAAKAGPAPMWAETLFFTHALAGPLFFLQPRLLMGEMYMVHVESYTHLLLNCLTQFVCIAGVYVVSSRTSAFTLALTLTLRKLASFTLSVLYFNHFRAFTLVEWIAMVSALIAGAAYPFLPKAGMKGQKAPRGRSASRSRSASLSRSGVKCSSRQ